MELHPLSPWVQARLGDLFPKLGNGKGKTVTLSEKSLAVTTLTKRSGSASPTFREADVWQWEGYLSPVSFFPQTRLSTRKHRTHPNWGIFYKLADHYPSEARRSWKTRKDWAAVTNRRRLRRHHRCSMGAWNGSWNRKETGVGKWWNLNKVWSLANNDS